MLDDLLGKNDDNEELLGKMRGETNKLDSQGCLVTVLTIIIYHSSSTSRKFGHLLIKIWYFLTTNFSIERPRIKRHVFCLTLKTHGWENVAGSNNVLGGSFELFFVNLAQDVSFKVSL
jgi:hypothetical protein